MQYLKFLIAGVDLVNNNQRVFDVVKTGIFKLPVMEYFILKAIRRFILHILLPTNVAHAGDDANIRRIHDELVVGVRSH